MRDNDTMFNQWRILLIGLSIMITLGGCFREAKESNVAPTQREVRLSDIQQQQTQNAPTRPATSRPTDTLEPIPIAFSPTPNKTLVIGGPPVSDDDTNTIEQASPTLSATNTPTPDIPTATPTITTVPPDEATVAPFGFGDTGISPTPSRTFTPTLEFFAATPTEILPEDECIYLVKGGDTIFGIARELEVSPDDIYAANPELLQNPDSLQIGQALRVPFCVSDEPTFPPAQISVTPNITSTDTEGNIIHIVQSGDTLFGIALRYDVSVEAIVAANEDLFSENTPIYPGQELIIPR
ncbi:MAG: hypothetical protein CUN55_05275 [Phototrophicales bacterium]|nr:MAG: hypothetical protein CUN55_05275 [Phototrophicales bacterium]